MDRDNTTILIDGYNYIGTIHGIEPSRLRIQREGLISMLKRYYRLRGIKIIVIFDSRDEVQTWNKSKVPGVTVKFTPPGMIADDWIVVNLHKIRGIVGVVTDDRELRGRIEKKGGFWVSCQEFKQAVEAFHMTQSDVDRDEPRAESVQKKKTVHIDERDSDVWNMFVDAAEVKPLHGKDRTAGRYALKKTNESAARMIKAMSRPTKQVIREKREGMDYGAGRPNYHSREELFRNRQIDFLKLLRGIG